MQYRLRADASLLGEILDKPNSVKGGKTVPITGGTFGIGKAVAAMGANVVISGRDAERGERAVEEIKGQSHNQSVDLILADLSVQSEVRRLAETFLASHDRLDVLVNNAGLVHSKRTETPDGIETTMAINHLAPFLLTNLLLDRLKESAPEVDGVSGKYFPGRKGIEAQQIAYDPGARRRLWEISEELTGLKVAA